MREIRFPGKTASETWRFTVLLRILELCHEALITGMIMTKRDLYYRDPDLFQKQTTVDRLVDDLAFTLDIERDDLNVVRPSSYIHFSILNYVLLLISGCRI